MYRFISGKKAPVYQCFSLGMLKDTVYHVWSAFQYLALWATNRNLNLYVLDRPAYYCA